MLGDSDGDSNTVSAAIVAAGSVARVCDAHCVRDADAHGVRDADTCGICAASIHHGNQELLTNAVAEPDRNTDAVAVRDGRALDRLRFRSVVRHAHSGACELA